MLYFISEKLVIVLKRRHFSFFGKWIQLIIHIIDSIEMIVQLYEKGDNRETDFIIRR